MNESEWDSIPAEWEFVQITWGDAEDGGPITQAGHARFEFAQYRVAMRIT